MKPAEMLAAFERLSAREKLLVALAVLALPAALMYQFLLTPMLASQDALEKRLAQSGAESARLALQIAALDNEARARDAAGKTRVAGLNRDMALQERRFVAIAERMVAAKDMPQMLQALLKKRPGLQLVSLRTRPPEAVRTPSGADGKRAAAGASQGGGGEEIYLHGVELAVEGSYGELLAWASDLEKLPQKMLWAGMKLQVQEYPRSTLELKLQTLSREKTWLEL